MRSLAGVYTSCTHRSPLPTVVMAHSRRIAIRRVTMISPRCATSLTCFQGERCSDLVQLLSDQGATSTLDYMQQYWLNAGGSNEELWNVRRVPTTWASC